MANNYHHHSGVGAAAVEDFILPRLAEWRQGQQAKVLKQFCGSISLTPINFHTLRACFATRLISEGVEAIKVMKVCGWMDLKTMARYVRLAGVEERGGDGRFKTNRVK